MDAFSSFFESQSSTSSRNSWTYDSLKKFRQSFPIVQTHLKLVVIVIIGMILLFSFPAAVARVLDADSPRHAFIYTINGDTWKRSEVDGTINTNYRDSWKRSEVDGTIVVVAICGVFFSCIVCLCMYWLCRGTSRNKV